MFDAIRRMVISWVVIIGLLSGSLIWGSDARPVIGKVLLSSRAAVGGIALPGEGTVLADDVLSTGKGGKALVDFAPAARAALGEETSVCFRRIEGDLVAELSSGILVAKEQSGQGLVIQTPKYRVQPAGRGEAIYLVGLLPDGSTVVAARNGQVSIREKSSGQSYVLPEGKFAAIPASATGVPASPGQEKEESRQAPGRQAPPAPAKPVSPPWHIGSLSPGASVALVGAVVAGGAAAAALPFAFGEEGPVSPTR